MNDILISGNDFSSTTLTFTAVTESGKNFMGQMFGEGAVSADLPKSRGFDFIQFAEQKGMKVL